MQVSVTYEELEDLNYYLFIIKIILHMHILMVIGLKFELVIVSENFLLRVRQLGMGCL